MTALFGALGLPDTDRSFVNVVGQRVVYDAVQQVLAVHNADLNAAMGVFVQDDTEDFKFRYKLPGGGYLQRRGGRGDRPGVIKAGGQWDVAFPLEDFGAAVAGDDVTLAYMTLQELDRQLTSVMQANINTTRLEILKALLDKTEYTFKDEIWGDLKVEPLANGDAVVYPPVLGAMAEATDGHYLGTNYLYSAIDDTHNPIPTIVAELEEHFGAPTGGSNIVTFINPQETPYIEALKEFDSVNDRFTTPGANTNQLTGLPRNVPGRIIGRLNSSWVSEWRFMPAAYLFGIHLEAPRPLFRRVDPAATGLGKGLQLVADREQDYPMETSIWRNRFGFGAGNRLNGVAVQLVASTTYTTPTGFAR